MSLLSKLKNNLENRPTKKQSEARRALKDESLVEDLKALKKAGYTYTAIADALNEELAPTFKERETSSPKSFFKNKQLPEGAREENGRVYYMSKPQFSPDMIQSVLDPEGYAKKKEEAKRKKKEKERAL